MEKSKKTILLGSIVLLGILVFSPIASQAQIIGTFSGGGGPEIRSVFVAQDIPIDPNASLWDNAPQVEVPVMGQNITIPILFNPTVKSVNVRSMNNGTWIGFWLEWADPTESFMALATHQFRDAIGVVFPATEGKTFIAMGGPGTPVNIMHWKADWQKDVDMQRYLDRQDAYPNMAYDLYVGDKETKETGEGDQGIEGGYNDPTNPRVPVEDVNKLYLPGSAAGNTFSTRDFPRQTPIEELVAEGFGTLTPQKSQNAQGKGVWENGMWNVVMARPMQTGDSSDAQFSPGENKDIAFAVWDGGNMEVNGRKSVALWHTLVVEPGAASAVIGKEPMVVAPAAEGASMSVIAASIIGAAIVAGAVIFFYARRRAPTIPK